MTFQPASPNLANLGGVVTAGQWEMGFDKLDLSSVALSAEGEAYPPSHQQRSLATEPRDSRACREIPKSRLAGRYA